MTVGRKHSQLSENDVIIGMLYIYTSHKLFYRLTQSMYILAFYNKSVMHLIILFYYVGIIIY